MAKATFGAGCFWGVEEEFRKIPGVMETAVGYTGGERTPPTRMSAPTARAMPRSSRSIRPGGVSYDQLLDVFWNNHNPTKLNRQGPDVGTQYRSAIFFHSPEQQEAARASKERLEKSGRFGRPIVTEISPASPSGAPRSTTSGTSRSGAAAPATSDPTPPAYRLRGFSVWIRRPARFAPADPQRTKETVMKRFFPFSWPRNRRRRGRAAGAVRPAALESRRKQKSDSTWPSTRTRSPISAASSSPRAWAG